MTINDVFEIRLLISTLSIFEWLCRECFTLKILPSIDDNDCRWMKISLTLSLWMKISKTLRFLPAQNLSWGKRKHVYIHEWFSLWWGRTKKNKSMETHDFSYPISLNKYLIWTYSRPTDGNISNQVFNSYPCNMLNFSIDVDTLIDIPILTCLNDVRSPGTFWSKTLMRARPNA